MNEYISEDRHHNFVTNKCQKSLSMSVTECIRYESSTVYILYFEDINFYKSDFRIGIEDLKMTDFETE